MHQNGHAYTLARQEMVRRQIKARGITDEGVLSAMAQIPRHLFVSEALWNQAYGDHPLPIGEGQTISQPYIVAEMSQALELDRNDTVLEIGTGCGYQTAILSRLAYKVYTIERIRGLFMRARKNFDALHLFNVVARCADGTLGWQEHAPYDAILVAAGGPKIPQVLVDQLAVGGRLVIPVGSGEGQDLIQVVKTRDGVEKRSLGACRFVKLIGKEGWES